MVHLADRVVIDTDALVGMLRGDQEWKDVVQRCEEHMVLQTTDMNAFELYFGAHMSSQRDRNLASVKGLLNTLDVLHTDEDAMEIAARVATDLRKKGEPIDMKDLLIGSIALVHGSPLLTGNHRHFQRIEGLEIWGGHDPEDGS